MSKLHVTQIEGYITPKLQPVINMKDYESHANQQVVKKAFLSRALAALAVSTLTDTPLVDLGSAITDGQKDGGIDAIYFDPSEKALYLVQAKWHESGHGSIDLGDALKFVDGVKKVLDNNLDGFNEKIKGRRSDIERAVYDANARFVLVIAHTGQEDLSDEVDAALTEYVTSQNDTSELMHVSILKQAELHKAVAEGVAGAPISAEVQLSSWGQVADPHYAVYGRVCAADVAAWLADHGNRLFEKNLRQFLGGSNVNQDLVDTLKTRPAEFWYFNNGITAIATEIAKKPIGGNSTESGIFECTGFCVVNGAQTVGSIHAAYQEDEAAVGKAYVPVRIISSSNGPEGFSIEVTRYTNTQNAIEKRDFVALDSEQERIRQELFIEGVEYAYKAGAMTDSGGQKFDLTEATIAMACMAADVGLAVQAKREISKLWDDVAKAPYKLLFNAKVSGPSVWEAVQALRAIESRLAVEKQKHTGREALVCVHGNRFIQWASLNKLGVKAGTPFAHVAAEVDQVVEDVVTRVVDEVKASYPDSYPASLFKNHAKCKDLAAKIA